MAQTSLQLSLLTHVHKFVLESYRNFTFLRLLPKLRHRHCDQIGRFIGLWATFERFWQPLICPNLTHSLAIFVKVLKSIIFLVKIFWATFIDIWRFFSGHTVATKT